jgi:hypothetical protein
VYVRCYVVEHDLYACMYCGLFGDVASISRICLMYSRVLPLIRNRALQGAAKLRGQSGTSFHFPFENAIDIAERVPVSITQLVGTCIVKCRGRVRTPDTPLIHLEKGEF